MEITIQGVCDRWSGLERPLFKGMLIDTDGCCCAQGDVLRLSGRSDDELRDMDQTIADREVARLLGISVAHSVLLRHVNDRQDGCPQDVLLHPERVLGDQAKRVLAFWQRIDFMTPEQWLTAREAAGLTAREAARETAWAAARETACDAAMEAAGVAAWEAAGAAAREAAREAAWVAARETAWAAARAAAGEAARAAAGAAAWAAARVAACDAAREASGVAAWEAAGAAAKAAAREAAGVSAGVAAEVAAGEAAGATNEIQGEAIMRERGQPFFFLPMFGINDPAELE